MGGYNECRKVQKSAQLHLEKSCLTWGTIRRNDPSSVQHVGPLRLFEDVWALLPRLVQCYVYLFIHLSHKIILLSCLNLAIVVLWAYFGVIGCCFHGQLVFYTKLQTWLSLCAITVPELSAVIRLCLLSTTCLTPDKPRCCCNLHFMGIRRL